MRKPIPEGKVDKRRVYPIDELRSNMWRAEVIKRSGCATNYALAKKFGGDQKKWASYEQGAQPNEVLLIEVNKELMGTMSIYTAGPTNLKLWPAISSEDSDVLSFIADMSDSIDGRIAAFRLAVMNGDITIDSDMGERKRPDDFDNELMGIFDKLTDEIGISYAKRVTDILDKWVKPYVEAIYHQQYAYFMDFIMDNRANNAYTEKILKEEQFNAIQLDTIKEKGRRIKTE